MTALRSLAELATLLTPRVIEVVDCECIVGRIIAHEPVQYTAFDITGRPLGVFTDLDAAKSAVRAAGTDNHGGAD